MKPDSQKYEAVIKCNELHQKILDYVSSDEIDKMISCTVFKEDEKCRSAIIHGMAIAGLLASSCEQFYIEKQNTNEVIT